MRSSETKSEPREDEVDETFPGVVTHDNHSVSKQGATKIQQGIAKNRADSKEAIRHSSSQLRTTKVSRQLCLLFTPTNVMYISSTPCK